VVTPGDQPGAGDQAEQAPDKQGGGEASPETANWHCDKVNDAVLDTILPSTAAASARPSVTFVRLRILADLNEPGEAPDVTTLAVERDSVTLIKPNLPELSHVIRDRGAEGVADYVTNQLDAHSPKRLGYLWQAKDGRNFAEAAHEIGGFQDSVHGLIGNTTEKIISGFGVPDAGVVGFVAEQVPIEDFDRSIGTAKLLIEITGILVAAATGVPVLACASSKALAGDMIHRSVAAGIRGYLDRPLEPAARQDRTRTHRGLGDRSARDPEGAGGARLPGQRPPETTRTARLPPPDRLRATGRQDRRGRGRRGQRGDPPDIGRS
jgi:hypothetical protein